MSSGGGGGGDSNNTQFVVNVMSDKYIIDGPYIFATFTNAANCIANLKMATINNIMQDEPSVASKIVSLGYKSQIVTDTVWPFRCKLNNTDFIDRIWEALQDEIDNTGIRITSTLVHV